MIEEEINSHVLNGHVLNGLSVVICTIVKLLTKCTVIKMPQNKESTQKQGISEVHKFLTDLKAGP